MLSFHPVKFVVDHLRKPRVYNPLCNSWRVSVGIVNSLGESQSDRKPLASEHGSRHKFKMLITLGDVYYTCIGI